MGITKTAAAIALLLAPTGAVVGMSMHESSLAVEQHTSYVEIILDEDEPSGPGYAAVAGLVTCRATNAFDNAVLWFNDQVLFSQERHGDASTCDIERNVTHVWATEADAPDPRGNPSLRPTGEVYEFTDPNNRHWVVNEYRYYAIQSTHEADPSITPGDTVAAVGERAPEPAGNLTNKTGAQALADQVEVHADARAQVHAVPFYTWVVELKSPTLDPTIVEEYNFVTLVDFEKLLLGPDGRTEHTGEGDPRDGDSHNASSEDEQHRLPHEHQTADVEIWVGGAPEPGQRDGSKVSVTVLGPGEVTTPSARAGPAGVTTG